MRAKKAMLLTALVLATTGCYDPFGPWGSTGSYRLLTANGQWVPAVVFDRVGEGAFTVTLLDGELRLRGDESFRLELDFVESDRLSDTYYTQGLSGTWDRYDDEIRLEYIDPDTGYRRSLGAYRRDHGQIEVTIPGLAIGLTLRVVFER